MQSNYQSVPGPEFGDQLLTVAQFCDRYPHLYPTLSRVRWLLRDRETNGLLDSGAVVEVFGHGERPAIYVYLPAWFAWMQSGGSRLRRPANHRAR